MRIPNRIQECSIMGIPIACISMKRFLSILDNRLEELSGNYICSTSAFTIIAAQKNKEYKLSQVDAFMRLPNDSITTLIAKFRGYPFVEKLHSKDIMEQIFLRSATKGYRHYFYGQSEEILTRLYENLHKKYPGLTFSPRLKRGDSCINHHCTATEVVASYTMSDRRYFPCVPRYGMY